jgi:hypothetical protein
VITSVAVRHIDMENGGLNWEVMNAKGSKGWSFQDV